MAEIVLHDATILDQAQWRQLQGISREAFTSTLNRTPAEIDALIDWGNPTVYRISHIDPNSQVGKRYNADQSFSKPRVAVAIEAGEPIGFAYSANNVSGANERIRRIKERSVVKNYLWLREVAVKPKFQQQRIAIELGRRLLQDAILLQPPTAYIWPDEIGFLQPVLERIGFKATDEKRAEIFGAGNPPVRQVRMQAASVRDVLKRL